MKRLALVLLLGSIALAVAGCAGAAGTPHTSKTSGSRPRQGAPSAAAISRFPLVVRDPKTVMTKAIRHLHGARFLSPTQLAFLTDGSRDCPNVPYRLVIKSPDSIRIDLTTGSGRQSSHQVVLVPKPRKGPCLADFVIFPIVVSIPRRVNAHHPLRLSLHYRLSKQPVVFTAPPF